MVNAIPTRMDTRALFVTILVFAVLLVAIGQTVDAWVGCAWRGAAPFCDPSGCYEHEHEVDRKAADGPNNFGSSCWSGTKKYCCWN